MSWKLNKRKYNLFLNAEVVYNDNKPNPAFKEIICASKMLMLKLDLLGEQKRRERFVKSEQEECVGERACLCMHDEIRKKKKERERCVWVCKCVCACVRVCV